MGAAENWTEEAELPVQASLLESVPYQPKEPCSRPASGAPTHTYNRVPDA